MSYKVYVGNLGENGDRETLEQEFSKFGVVESVWMARNPPGFAFVGFNDLVDAEEAVRVMDNKRVCGVKIKVELSHTPKKSERSEGAGRGRGMIRGGRSRGMARDDPSRVPPRDGPPRGLPRDGPPRGHPRDGPGRGLSRGPPRDAPLRDGPPRMPQRDISPRGRHSRGRPGPGPRPHGPPLRRSPDLGLETRNQRGPPQRRTPPPKWTERESPPRGLRRSLQEGPVPRHSPPRAQRMRPPSPRLHDFEEVRPTLSPRREMQRRSPLHAAERRRPHVYGSPSRGQSSIYQQGLSAERIGIKRSMMDRSPPRGLPFKKSPPGRIHSLEALSDLPARRPPVRGLPVRDQPPLRRGYDDALRGPPLRGSSPGRGRGQPPRRSPPRFAPQELMLEREDRRDMFEQGRRPESRERLSEMGPPSNRSRSDLRIDARGDYIDQQDSIESGRRLQDFFPNRKQRQYGDRGDEDHYHERDIEPTVRSNFNRPPERGAGRGMGRGIDGGGWRPANGNLDRFDDRPHGERLLKRMPPSTMDGRMPGRPPAYRRGERGPPEKGGFQRSRSPLR